MTQIATSAPPTVDIAKGPAAAGPVDIHVGQRIRLRRTLMGLSQEKLGEALGLTFQQVQKYERGANRVSASRLYELARVMEVPVSFFYDGMAGVASQSAQPLNSMMGFAEAPSTFGGPPPKRLDASSEDATLFGRRETIDLVRAYYRIPDTAVRKRMFDLIRSMAPSED
ncbi:helix-turn-helix domain-containing protein [Brytella acorum]|uniref:Helix-turn-helix transcriptional regulator n=1 Tax=Brytella acorum TaxID=2959299 RepID=A0AA35UKL7_9PROT|nr:helix-turn-helix transcriptional regulator [Brytella acorum]MDF3624987.1 helix-turn-helix transcriptional regulator [Brytella acorum]CAI9122172.1 helix-turn-helix transcriptional regulator [Brytella acorum]